MIPVLMRVAWNSLKRDRAALVMKFVLPIAFYSIFAVIFGGPAGDGGTPRVDVLVVDESHTDVSRALIRALAADPGLRVHTRDKAEPAAGKGAPAGNDSVDIDRARAEVMVRTGEAPVAIVLPAGIDTSVSRFDGLGVRAELLTDPSDRVAPKMAAGLLQRAALTASREIAAEFTGGHGDAKPVDDLMPIRTHETAVVGRKRTNGMTSFYAAGIAVMFLMFSASATGGALLDEVDSGTLERVLSSRVTMTTLLAAKWLDITRMGILSITVMFTWAMLVFKVPLLSHLPGFVLMTVFTAACAAAFGLVLATLARTRQQLQGLVNLIVLSLSAIGGSMFPRFLMSETLQKLSLVGFNAWALDGYVKVFWRDASVASLWPQLTALAGFTVLFLFLARRLATRWEVA